MRPRSKVSIAAGDALMVLRKRSIARDRNVAPWVLEAVENLQYLRNKKGNADRLADWKEKNPEKAKELSREISRRYTKNNYEKVREACRQSDRRRYLEHPTRKYSMIARGILHTHKRRAQMLSVPFETITPAQWQETLEVFGHRCGYCLKKTKLTRDHVTALARGGSHTLDNLAPACEPCNKSKNARGVLAMVNRKVSY